MTAIATVTKRTSTPVPCARARGSQSVIELRGRFPSRATADAWPGSLLSRAEVLDILNRPPYRYTSQDRFRARGAESLLDWLATHPGDSWQARWLASGAEDADGREWMDIPISWLSSQGRMTSYLASDLRGGLLAVQCADVLRPGLRWIYQHGSHNLTSAMELRRDPVGMARMREALTARNVRPALAAKALHKVAVIMATKGGLLSDITVGDCVEAVDVQSTVQCQAWGASLFYEVLHELGQLPADAPATIRPFRSAGGQLTIEQLVDRYRITCTPVRDLLVEYLKERQPALDYSTLRHLARVLASFFWRDLELHEPGINSLRLSPQTARAWKDRGRYKTTKVKQPDGSLREIKEVRDNYKSDLLLIRAFYLDIAQWAVEDPARWAIWTAPCPISKVDVDRRKENRRTKSRMDQRTRERMPALPRLVASNHGRRQAATARLESLMATQEGEFFTVLGETFRRVPLSNRSGSTWAQSIDGSKRRDLAWEEHEAFWGWAAVEVLRHTGIRIEELGELSHHSITQYRLPSTNELVPLLQIAPSKTDEERLILVSPELADVLSAIVCRVRDTSGAIPLVTSYDSNEQVWNPPMALLVQRTFAGERRAIRNGTLRSLLNSAFLAAGLLGDDGKPLRYAPHDFRRLFVTDTVMSGLPPHIAQVICGHKDINTTMGYKAIYPAEAIEAHRAFIARRRSLRPGMEYRTPTTEEWDAFLAHFEKRKLSVGTCARAFGTPCIHEHACVRCAMLRPDPTQRDRLVEIRDNLVARIAEAEREGWLGEVEGLQVSLAGATDKLAQLDTEKQRAQAAIDLGMPSLRQLTAQTSESTGPCQKS
ncbi:site-specific integrase [Streptomyces sp. NPDC006459]|uniref:site-specific integrase n=1 Tax=Streptomyces sp. NPDC006459 TaxID=3154303 RepID=UPI0033A5CC41